MIHLYAEHLINIRTLSIQASLSTISNQETKATLSADGTTLTLSHEGETASVKLPINISPNQASDVQLTIPAVPSRDLSFRIQLEEKAGVTESLLSKGAVSDSGHFIPWTADSLSEDTEIYCRECSSILVERGKVGLWKDLPSEGWAEMMEFWHCHKPNEPHDHDHANSKKGHAADSQLALESGVGLVDIMDFLLVAKDCSNVKVSDAPATSSTSNTLLCIKCDSLVGYFDLSSQAIKLRKLALQLSPSKDSKSCGHDLEKWFACLLLSAMDTQGVRKFVICQSETSSGAALKVWIFAPDLKVSSSVSASKEPVRVAKIMWQDFESSSNNTERLNGSAMHEGELNLSGGELASLRANLSETAELLPEGGRKFQQWHVGMLRTFTADDLASS